MAAIPRPECASLAASNRSDQEAPSRTRDARRGPAKAPTVAMFGRWAPPFLTFARRCAALGLPVYFFDVGKSPSPWRRYSSCLAGGVSIDPSRVGTRDGIERVTAAVEAVRADALVALSETHLHWLAAHRGRFEPGCKLLMPELGVLESLARKTSQIDLAARAGFDVLPTWTLVSPADVACIPPGQYPLALRPDVPFNKCEFKVALAHSADELRAFVAGLPAIEHVIVAQPFRPWPNLLVHGVRAESGEILELRAYLVERKFEGLALALRSVPLPPHVGDCCRNFVSAAGLVGCFHYDLLYSPVEQRAYFLEINPRLGGTTDKVARLGYDEPLLTLAAFGFPVSVAGAVPPADGRAVVNKRALVKHLAWALGGKLSELDYPGVNRFAHAGGSLRDLLCARDSVFDWRDLRGSLWFYLRI